MKAKPSQARAASLNSTGVRGRERAENAPTPTRGRPRTIDAGLSPADRAAAWQQDWERLGGHRFTVNLGPEAWAALRRLARKRQRSALLERLILQEARSRPAAAQAPASPK